MRLVISIIHSDDAPELIEALTEQGFRATVISTTGGFLREGNATVLIGIEDEKTPAVLQVIRDHCHARTQYINPLPPVVEPGELHMPRPVEVQIGGAVVFVLEVERFERF